jgi:hypothetical protein
VAAEPPQDREVVAIQRQKDVRDQVEFIVFQQRDPAASRRVLDDEYDQHQEAIDEALPSERALAKAIIQ